MAGFSNKFKKPYLWPIFGAKKIFLENSSLSRTASYGFLAPCQNFKKVNDTVQKKSPDGRKDGRKDRQTLFYRTLPATAGGPIYKDYFRVDFSLSNKPTSLLLKVFKPQII